MERRKLYLDIANAKLDKFDLITLDELAYVTNVPAETTIMFELIPALYERWSIWITANQSCGEWNKVFPDPASTTAASTGLFSIHHFQDKRAKIQTAVRNGGETEKRHAYSQNRLEKWWNHSDREQHQSDLICRSPELHTGVQID